MTSRRRSRARSLRSLLTVLVALPLSLCVALTVTAILGRVDHMRTAEDVVDKVRSARSVWQLQNSMYVELLPELSLHVLETPALRKAVGIGSGSPASYGVSRPLVNVLRAKTDADLAGLKATSSSSVYAQARLALSRLRSDTHSSSSLSTDYDKRTFSIIRRLSETASAALVDSASAAPHDLALSIRDASLAGAATQASVSELGILTGAKFPLLGVSTTAATGHGGFLDAWALYTAASNAALTSGSTVLSTQWRRAISTQPIARYEDELRAFAENPNKTVAIPELIDLYQSNYIRSTRFAELNAFMSARVEATAKRYLESSTSSAWVIGGLVVLALGLSLLIAMLVRRAIARPLNRLAGLAEAVSRGELIDVTPSGPREIRTVGTGLSAAVQSLRRVEAQASAVAQGDLTSDVVSVPLDGPLGEVMHRSVTTIVDAIRERDLAQDDLAFQATHDSLTGLPNRNQALVSIPHALQRGRRSGELTCLMFVDLDYFKSVNDNLGHAAGDMVLREVARRMKASVRESDIVFRLGGDEFVILLDDVSRDFPFVAFAEKLICEVSRPIPVEGTMARVGASIGVSLSQDASVDAERLLGEADAAAYSAKSSGRGRVGFFDDDLRSALTQRTDVERGLEAALTGEGLVLDFQPVVEIGQGRPVGFEALLRWRHPERGIVPPAEFIPIAEKSNLINRIGRWTLRAALTQLAEWDATGSVHFGLTMAVNISGRHLMSRELVGDVREALTASGVAAERLMVEITETVIVDDPIALDNMQQLRDMGVGVAIDDFGTGYTSIGQLPKLPVDVLKIDRSFTSLDGRGHRELVRLIVEAAHALDLTVVAEGIEGSQQADAMRDLDVDTGQGFYYARPDSPLNAAWLGSRHALPAERLGGATARDDHTGTR